MINMELLVSSISIAVVMVSPMVVRLRRLYVFVLLCSFASTLVISTELASHLSFAAILMWVSTASIGPGVYMINSGVWKTAWIVLCMLAYVTAWFIWFL